MAFFRRLKCDNLETQIDRMFLKLKNEIVLAVWMSLLLNYASRKFNFNCFEKKTFPHEVSRLPLSSHNHFYTDKLRTVLQHFGNCLHAELQAIPTINQVTQKHETRESRTKRHGREIVHHLWTSSRKTRHRVMGSCKTTWFWCMFRWRSRCVWQKPKPNCDEMKEEEFQRQNKKESPDFAVSGPGWGLTWCF